MRTNGPDYPDASSENAKRKKTAKLRPVIAAMEIKRRDQCGRNFNPSLLWPLGSIHPNGGRKSGRSGNVLAAAGTDAPRPLVGTLVVHSTCKATL